MQSPASVIDFTSDRPSAWFTPTDTLRCNTVHVARGIIAPNPGVDIATTQLVVAIHESARLDVTWRAPGAERTRRTRVGAGDVHITPGNRPFYIRWSDQTAMLVISFKDRLVERVGEHFGKRRAADLDTIIGVRDMDIEAVSRRLRREMNEGGVSGPMFLESLAVIVLTRLFRAYASGVQPPEVKGGLGAIRFQRIIDYIDGHLGEPITLEELARVAGLSMHHFSDAFRASAGIAPHRFILERRVERARDLLMRTDAPITAIATMLGFASHGHFSTQFRKITGTTPTKYRSANE